MVRMIGQLPQSLYVSDTEYKIRSDYRNILTIISAFNDPSLSDKEKAVICLRRLYVDADKLPDSPQSYDEALQKAVDFIEYRLSDDRPGPQVVDWAKDEPLIFPSINRAAGIEVRAVPYMHWWTFLGYFQEAGRNDLWGMVLTIRQKKKKGKKLEKHEKEFYAANRDLCSLESDKAKTPEDTMAAIYQELMKNKEDKDA